MLDDAGFVGTLATNSEFEIERYLHLGEVVSATTVIESISEREADPDGPGHFVTWVTTYTVDAGEVVGRQRFRILKFRPGARDDPSWSTDTLTWETSPSATRSRRWSSR